MSLLHVQQRVKSLLHKSCFLFIWFLMFFLLMFFLLPFYVFTSVFPNIHFANQTKICFQKKILLCLQLGYTFEPQLPAPASHSVKQFWAKAGRQGQAGKARATKIPAADLTQCLGGISPSMTCCFSKGCCCSLLTTMISDAVIDNHSSGWLRDARSWWMLVHRHLFQTQAAANWDGKWPTCQSMFTEINITQSVLCNCPSLIVYITISPITFESKTMNNQTSIQALK